MPPPEMNFTGNSRRCRFSGARQADGRTVGQKFALAIGQKLRESLTRSRERHGQQLNIAFATNKSMEKVSKRVNGRNKGGISLAVRVSFTLAISKNE